METVVMECHKFGGKLNLDIDIGAPGLAWPLT